MKPTQLRKIQKKAQSQYNEGVLHLEKSVKLGLRIAEENNRSALTNLNKTMKNLKNSINK